MKEYGNIMPEGVEDIQWKEYELKEEMEERIKRVFKSFGYKQVTPPSFEYYDLFSDNDGTIEKDEMLKFIDSTGRVLVLRPDPTAPVARMAASNPEGSENYQKYFYSVNVFRSSISNTGRKREFLQAGIEYLGNSSVESDGEVIAAAIRSMLSCGLGDICIDIGHAGFFKGLMYECGISGEDEYQVRKYVEEKNLEGVQRLLWKLKVDKNKEAAIRGLLFLYGSPSQVLEKAEEMSLNQRMKNAVKDLKDICSVLEDYGYKDYIQLDMGFINHLNYYTGAIFMGYVKDHGSEMLRGGRYDNLTGQYGCSIPATGFGINVDELIEVIKTRGLYKTREKQTDYLLIYTAAYRGEALRLSMRLRDMGYVVEAYPLVMNKEEILTKTGSMAEEIVTMDGQLLQVWNSFEDCSFTCTAEAFLKRAGSSDEMAPRH